MADGSLPSSTPKKGKKGEKRVLRYRVFHA